MDLIVQLHGGIEHTFLSTFRLSWGLLQDQCVPHKQKGLLNAPMQLYNKDPFRHWEAPRGHQSSLFLQIWLRKFFPRWHGPRTILTQALSCIQAAVLLFPGAQKYLRHLCLVPDLPSIHLSSALGSQQPARMKEEDLCTGIQYSLSSNVNTAINNTKNCPITQNLPNLICDTLKGMPLQAAYNSCE